MIIFLKHKLSGILNNINDMLVKVKNNFVYSTAMVGFLEPHTLYAENTIYLYHKINCYLFLIWPLVFSVLIATLIRDSKYLRNKLAIVVLFLLENYENFLQKYGINDMLVKDPWGLYMKSDEGKMDWKVKFRGFVHSFKITEVLVLNITTGVLLWLQKVLVEYTNENWNWNLKGVENDETIIVETRDLETSEFAAYEIILTITPVIILIFIFIESGLTVYAADAESQVSSFVNVKVIGAQWYWVYDISFDVVGYKELSENVNIRTLEEVNYNFVSNLITDEDLEKGNLRLLQVDNILYLPVNTPVKVNITSRDVLHSFALPTAGWKMDAIPGRLNEMMFILKQPGIHVGMCSELCGVGHSAMPIMIHAVPVDEFLKVYGVNLKLY